MWLGPIMDEDDGGGMWYMRFCWSCIPRLDLLVVFHKSYERGSQKNLRIL